MFHIFSGPLFANLEGYVFLDLLIWGISPIIFWVFRTHIIRLITPDGRIGYRRRRFILLLLWSVSIFISFLFMNYSESFRWNYFSRIINLDFGYLLFDISCRCMQVM
jgi:hypothetical protein